MPGLILIVMLASAFWAASLYLRPFRKCGRCEGAGRLAKGARGRVKTCGRCKGVGRVQRIGSGLAHRTALTVRAERKRERRSRWE